MNAVLRFLRGEPALTYQTVFSLAVALAVAYAHLTHTQNGYLTAIALGLGTIISGILAKPRRVALVSGAVGTVLASLVVFSVHLPPSLIGTIVAATGLVLGQTLRGHLTPVHK